MNASPSADDVNRDFQKAVEHYQGNRFAEATALLDRLAPHCGGRADYFRLRGHIAMRNRDAAAALTALQRAAELARADAKWNKWMAQGATHLVVLADLPGARQDRAGTQDERRQIVPLDQCHWPKKATNLIVQVQRSGINVLTPPRPVK